MLTTVKKKKKSILRLGLFSKSEIKYWCLTTIFKYLFDAVYHSDTQLLALLWFTAYWPLTSHSFEQDLHICAMRANRDTPRLVTDPRKLGFWYMQTLLWNKVNLKSFMRMGWADIHVMKHRIVSCRRVCFEYWLSHKYIMTRLRSYPKFVLFTTMKYKVGCCDLYWILVQYSCQSKVSEKTRVCRNWRLLNSEAVHIECHYGVKPSWTNLGQTIHVDTTDCEKNMTVN